MVRAKLLRKCECDRFICSVSNVWKNLNTNTFLGLTYLIYVKVSRNTTDWCITGMQFWWTNQVFQSQVTTSDTPNECSVISTVGKGEGCDIAPSSTSTTSLTVLHATWNIIWVPNSSCQCYNKLNTKLDFFRTTVQKMSDSKCEASVSRTSSRKNIFFIKSISQVNWHWPTNLRSAQARLIQKKLCNFQLFLITKS